MANVSRDIQWAIIRNTSSFRHIQRGVPKPFCKDPMNMKGVHAFRYSGLVNPKAINIVSKKDKKGKATIVMLRKNKSAARKPNKQIKESSLGKHGRNVLKTVRGTMKGSRPAHTMLAMRRASNLMRANKSQSAKQIRMLKHKK